MKWIKISVNTTKDGIGQVCGRLSALGHDTLEIEDWDDFKDFVDNRKPLWQSVEDGLEDAMRGVYRVSFYAAASLPESESETERVRAALDGMDNAPFTVTASVSDDADWEDNWKRYYKPIAVGRRILIQPEWEPLTNNDGRAVFWCDPGAGFGTGSHATTYMCLELLDELIAPGMRVADLGCGSGILSVTSLLLGASEAVALDVDQLAVDATLRNAARNGFHDMAALRGDLLGNEIWESLGKERFDVVCANLVSDVVKAAAPRIAQILRPGGRVFASGILERDAEGVADALKSSGLTAVQTKTREGWAALCLISQKK